MAVTAAEYVLNKDAGASEGGCREERSSNKPLMITVSELVSDKHGINISLAPRSAAIVIGLPVACPDLTGISRATLSRAPCPPSLQTSVAGAMLVLSVPLASFMVNRILWVRKDQDISGSIQVHLKGSSYAATTLEPGPDTIVTD